jgi:hypothetical protein
MTPDPDHGISGLRYACVTRQSQWHIMHTHLSAHLESYVGASEEAVNVADQAVTVPMSSSFTKSFNVSGEPTMYDV